VGTITRRSGNLRIPDLRMGNARRVIPRSPWPWWRPVRVGEP